MPEVLVLGRHHRVPERRRELAVVEDHPVGLAELAHLGLAVAEVDLGGLLHDGRLDIGDGGLGVGVRHPHRGRDDHEADERRDQRQRLLPGPVPPPAALAARLFAAGVVRTTPVAGAVTAPAPGPAARLIPVALHTVAAQPLTQVVPDVTNAGAEPGRRAAAGAALTPGARAVVLASRPPRLILARCAAPARRLGRGGGVRPSVVLADPAAGAAGRGDPAAAARSTTAQGPTRRPVRAPAVPPATGRPPGTVSGARAGREGTAPAWLVAVRNIWVTHASSLVWMSQSGRGRPTHRGPPYLAIHGVVPVRHLASWLCLAPEGSCPDQVL